VKAEHQRTVGLLQPLPIPEWKWEHIAMGFVTALSRSSKGHNVVWEIMDSLTKNAHFMPFRVGKSTETFAECYMQEIVRLHGGINKHCVRSRQEIFIPLLAEFID